MTETPHPHAVFWIDLAKITPNPYQPRKFFDPQKLQDLSDSIRRYGVLQPIVVTRMEEFTQEGGMVAKYEIIAGERRFRASKLAGLEKIPAIIREGDQTDQEKLELAILENLQREDLNPVDKARSFNRLVTEFNHTHAQVAESLGKSREYVSNSLRLLQLPDMILDALSEGKISEGHTRPLLMLKERPDEQQTLFMQMTSIQGMTVRDAEKFARSIATEKQRKNKDLDPEMKEIQQKLASHLGTKVSIDKKSQGGKLTIEFGNKNDLRQLFEKIQAETQIITERAAGPTVVASTADIGRVSTEPQAQQSQEQTSVPVSTQAADITPAYETNAVRMVAADKTTSTQPEAHSSVDISALQQEIYSLADAAKPDAFAVEPKEVVLPEDDVTFDAQSQYSYRQAIAREQEPVVENEDKFGFHANIQPVVDSTQENQTRVDVVSQDAFDSFGVVDHAEPVHSVNAVALGNDFVPEKPQSAGVSPEAVDPVTPQSWGSMTSSQVNDEFPTESEDIDLYRLDDFSV